MARRRCSWSTIVSILITIKTIPWRRRSRSPTRQAQDGRVICFLVRRARDTCKRACPPAAARARGGGGVPGCGPVRGRASRAVCMPSAYLDGLEVPFSVNFTRTFDVQQRARPALPRIRRAGAPDPVPTRSNRSGPAHGPAQSNTAACLS